MSNIVIQALINYLYELKIVVTFKGSELFMKYCSSVGSCPILYVGTTKGTCMRQSCLPSLDKRSLVFVSVFYEFLFTL